MRLSHDAPPAHSVSPARTGRAVLDGDPADARSATEGSAAAGSAAAGGGATPSPKNPVAIDATTALRMLRDDHQLDVAPHVAAHLTRRLGGDPDGIIQTAHLLSPGQLRGHNAPADPLPLVPAASDLFAPALASLTDAGRRALLVASISVSRRTDILLQASGLTVSDLVSEALSPFLQLVSGHFAIRDPRIRSVVHETATLSERTRAHADLAVALAAAGRAQLAAWHSALATLEGDPSLASELTALARTALRRGDSIWAYRVAREAASQAQDSDRTDAELTAGIAAMLSGFVADAVYWLGRVRRSGDHPRAVRALPAYVIAVTLSSGYVPDAELAEAEAECEAHDCAGSDGMIGALAVAAALHAERSNHRASRDALGRCERAAGSSGHGGGYLAVAQEWCATFSAEASDVDTPRADAATIEPHWLAGYLVAARSIRLAVAGDVAQARAMLLSTSLRLSRDTAQAIDGGPQEAATPFLEAHLGTAGALVTIAAGGYGTAAEQLEAAQLAGPANLVLGGIIAAASGRMTVLITGRAAGPGEARAPHETTVLQRASLIDRAFAHDLAGHPDEAAAVLALATEITATPVERLLPEPDECSLWADAGQPEHAAAARRTPSRGPANGSAWIAALRATLTLSTPHEARRLRAGAEEACRGITSLYDRATTTLALSRALARAGDDHTARALGVAAVELLFQTGAPALVAHSRRLLLPAVDRRATTRNLDDSWATELTEREREVAGLVVLGTSNRDVARELHLSVRTIEVHLARVFAKLDVHSRTELSYRVHGGIRAANDQSPSR